MNEVGIATYEPGPMSMMAAFGGTLAEHEGCLGVGGTHPGQEQWGHLVVPRGYEHPAPGVVLRVGVRDYRLGDEVSFGGGLVDASSMRRLVRPPGCRHGGSFVVMNHEG